MPADHMVTVFAREGSPQIAQLPREYYEYDIAPKLLAIQCTFAAVALITLLLRMHVRLFILKIFGMDDWLILGATILSLVQCSCFIVATRLGLGRHWITIPLKDFEEFFVWMYIYGIVVVIAVSMTKLSIGCFLLRIAQRRLYSRLLYGSMIFVVTITTVAVLTLLLQCIPISAGWDLSMRPPYGRAKCYSALTYRWLGVMNSIINIFTDLLYATLPIPLIWSLRLNIRTKISLVVILGLGMFACIVAIVKTPMQYHFMDEKDPTGDGAYYFVWQVIELNVGIIAACLATLKPLFRRFLETARPLGGSGQVQCPRRYESSYSYNHRVSNAGYIRQDVGPFALSDTSSRVMPEKPYHARCSSDQSEWSPSSLKDLESGSARFGADLESRRAGINVISPERARIPGRYSQGAIMQTTEVSVVSDTQ